MKTRFDIIHSIVGGAMSGTPDGIDITFKDGQVMPSEEQISAKEQELVAEASSKQDRLASVKSKLETLGLTTEEVQDAFGI